MMKSKRLVGLLFATITIGSVFLSTGVASAQVTVSGGFTNAAYWQLTSITYDSSEIGDALSTTLLEEISGVSNANTGLTILNSYLSQQAPGFYFDRDASDETHEWVKNDCGTSRMRHQEGKYQLVNLYVNFPTVGCKDIMEGGKDISLPGSASDGPASLLFAFTDPDTIVRTDSVGGAFELSDPTNFPTSYFSSSSGFVEVRSGNIGIYKQGTTLIEYKLDGSVVSPWSVRPYDAANPYTPPVAGGGPTGGPVGGGTIEPSCANSSDGGALKWIFCGILERMDGALNWLEQKVQELLYVRDPANTGGAGINPAASESLRVAWSRFRNIALIILVPIMLVMIIGTAVGASAFDAYTIKRAMPRFLVAIIFISVSWYITSFLINLTNVVGTGIQGIMLSPFTFPDGTRLSDNLTASQLLEASDAIQSGTLALGLLGALSIGGAVTIGVLFSMGLTFVVSLFIGWFILSIRQMLIYALVLAAPLAILSWIFPNNDKLWKIWWTTFSTLLIMFPLLMMLIGATKIFAYVIATLELTI